MASHFSDIGFNLNNPDTFREDFIKIIEDNVEKSSQEVCINYKGYLVVYIDNDIEFWLPIGENGTLNPYDFEIHYNTHKWELAKKVTWTCKEENDMQGLCNLWQNQEIFPLNANIPNAIMCPSFNEKLTYKCQLACFVEDINFYSTIDEFRKEYHKMCEESFIPTGMFALNENKEFKPSACAWINGILESFELKTNTYTKNKFYHLIVGCLGEKFDLLVSEEEIKSPLKIGDIVSSNVWISGKIRFDYLGQEIGNTKRVKDGNSNIKTLNDLYNVLKKCWSKETAYPSCQEDWNKEDPAYGQCAITSMLVYDMFGGSIHRIKFEDGSTHYFNKINDTYVDLTSEQFDLYNIIIDYTQNEQIDRQYCGKNTNTNNRYNLLVANISKHLKTL